MRIKNETMSISIKVVFFLLLSLLCAKAYPYPIFFQNFNTLKYHAEGLSGDKPDMEDVLEVLESRLIYEKDIKAMFGEKQTLLNRIPTCAVVGSSIELVHKDQSKEIDDHDVVFRVGAYYDKAIFTLPSSSSSNGRVGGGLEPICTGRSCYWGMLGKKMDLYYVETYDMVWVRRVMSPTWRSQNTTVITALYNWGSARDLARFLRELDPQIRVTVITPQALNGAYVQMSSFAPNKRSLSSKQVLHTVLAASFACGPLARVSHHATATTGDGSSAAPAPTPPSSSSGGGGVVATPAKTSTGEAAEREQYKPISLYGGYVPYVGLFGGAGTWIGSINTSVPFTTDEWEVLKKMHTEGEIEIKDLDFHLALYDKGLASRLLGWSDLPNPAKLKRNITMPSSDETLAPRGRVHQTCAVVGSDAGMTYLGPQIDAHEAVFRANHHFGSNLDVNRFGNKTTYLLVNPEADVIIRNMSDEDKKLLENIETSYILPLFQHLNSYLYEPSVFPFQANYGTSGVRWSTTTGFASFLMAYYRCNSVDLYGFSVGLPVISLHTYMDELLALKTLEFQNRFAKNQPTVRLFLNPEVENHVFRWLIALEKQTFPDFGPGITLGATPVAQP